MDSFDDDWGRPVENNGEFARPEVLQGHLLIVFPLGHVAHIQTKFTVPGKKSDAICCDVVDLDDKDEAGNAGKIYRTSNLMQARIIQDLKPFIGRKVLGRIGKGVSKNGMNPPWVITDMSGDGALMERARAWAQANPNFVKSEFVAWDDSAVAAATQVLQQGFGQTQPAYQNQRDQPQGYQQEWAQPQQQQPYYPPQPQYQPVQQQQYPPQQQQDYQPPYQGYAQPPQPEYSQQSSPPPPQPQPQYQPVAGSAQLTDGERSVLERMREQQNRRSQGTAGIEEQRRQQQAGFQDPPPF
jgi:hypothetical protein